MICSHLHTAWNWHALVKICKTIFAFIVSLIGSVLFTHLTDGIDDFQAAGFRISSDFDSYAEYFFSKFTMGFFYSKKKYTKRKSPFQRAPAIV